MGGVRELYVLGFLVIVQSGQSSEFVACVFVCQILSGQSTAENYKH